MEKITAEQAAEIAAESAFRYMEETGATTRESVDYAAEVYEQMTGKPFDAKKVLGLEPEDLDFY